MFPRDDTIFIVWGQPGQGPRSQVLARELGIDALHFISAPMKRGLLLAPLRYAYQAVQTLRLLFRKRPRLVLVQSPPSLAVLFVHLYCALTGNHYLIDAHSMAFAPYWTYPRWLHRRLARRALATIVTNDHLRRTVEQWGGRAFVLRDIPTRFPRVDGRAPGGDFSVVVVNSFAPDEPLDQVLEAAADLNDIQFYVTGRFRDGSRKLADSAPANVHFTGFLPNDEYYGLMAASQAVVCLTNRDHTMQRGACEALWMGKPIITSDWPMLREYFSGGTVYVPSGSAEIRQGVLEMKANHAHYLRGIQELQIARRNEWQEKVRMLTDLVESGVQGARN